MTRIIAVASLALLLGVAQAARVLADPPRQTTQAPQDQAQQRPVFRAGANFVAVDVYPRRDGLAVEGLTADDFQVLEDGVPQTIETFEFLRVGRVATMEERRDPTSPQDARRQAADPRTQVFVLYLDGQHIDNIDPIEGPRKATGPVLAFLRETGARDLFGVMTSNMEPDDLVLGRRLEVVEDAVAAYWNRALEMQRDDRTTGGVPWPRSEYEAMLRDCPVRGVNQSDLLTVARLEHALENLRGLSRRLGAMREFRSHVLLVSGGWNLQAVDPARLIPSFAPPPPQVTSRGGRLRVGAPEPGYGADPAVCNAEIFRLASLDLWRLYQDVLEAAEQNNVAIHTVDPQGMAAFDEGTVGATARRLDTLQSLSSETGGRSIVATDDVAGQLQDLSDDLASYYLLGYYSTNGAFDGEYRQIEVRTTQDDVEVSARPGYLAPTAEEVAAFDAARASGTPGDADTAIADALADLARVDGPQEVFAYGVSRPGELVVIAEIAEAVFGRAIESGASIRVDVTDQTGAEASGRAEVPAAGRGLEVVVPTGSAGTGPWRAAVVVDGSTAERIDIEPAAITPITARVVYRARSPRSAPLWPAAQMSFRRTERVHIEWSASGPLDQREARLLGPDGQALPIAVTLAEQNVDGRPTLTADVSLAALGAGDYVIEVTATANGVTVIDWLGIRVSR